MDSDYPYAQLEKDGYELAVVEAGNATRVLAVPLAPDEERFAAKPGDTVKVIFQYRDADRRENGAVVDAEHMWVEITDCRAECIVGVLDSSPQHTQLLHSGDAVCIHPKHIVAFWRK
jgi:uncharacterized protein YegJ (DUF2314 family)